MSNNVLSVGAASPDNALVHFDSKLAFETDPSDVYADIKSGNYDFVLVDVRSPEAYANYHALTAINIPHKEITEERMAEFDKNTFFIVYCWGPGCNGATKAGYKLSNLGYKVKEMIGGIEYWLEREHNPITKDAG